MKCCSSVASSSEVLSSPKGAELQSDRAKLFEFIAASILRPMCRPL